MQSNRPLATFGVDWVYILVLFVYGAILLGAFDIIDNLSILIPLTLILYLLTLQILGSFAPKIHLFEDGIKIVKRDTEKKFQWCEITSISGIRHYHSFNLLPTTRYGANTFHSSDDTQLFAVSAFMINATPLVKYIIAKIAECSVDVNARQIETDSNAIYIDNLQINTDGIECEGTLYQWFQIANLSLKKVGDERAKVLIKLKETDHSILLGEFDWYSSILLIGYVDSFTKSNHLKHIMSETINIRKRMIIWARRIAIFSVALVVFVITIEIANTYLL